MKYRLIATDMDGTLLNDDKAVSPATVAALKEAMEKGILVTVCTGRNITGISEFRKIINPNGPIICNNGAIIMSADGKSTLYNRVMDSKDARDVYELGMSLGTTLLIWCDNVFYTNVLNDKSYGYKKYSGMDPVLLEDFDSLLEKGITKILYCGEPDEVNAYLEKVNSLRLNRAERISENNDGSTAFLRNTTNCKSLPIFLEFFNSEVSKGNALKFIAEYCGFSTDEMIAFGDGMNDYSMIETAGYGVAMENACDEIKKIADFVTLSNNEDGIAYALNRVMP